MGRYKTPGWEALKAARTERRRMQAEEGVAAREAYRKAEEHELSNLAKLRAERMEREHGGQ
jgi:hypothetical protein